MGLYDVSVGHAPETTYRTFATPTIWLPDPMNVSPIFTPNWKQSVGMRTGFRTERNAGAFMASAKGGLSVDHEIRAKGLGKYLSYHFGNSVSALVSGTTYQQLHKFASTDLPSFSAQVGLPQQGGSVDFYNILGAKTSTFDLEFNGEDSVQIKSTFEAADTQLAGSGTTPNPPTLGTIFQFAQASIFSGTITHATGTALASATAALAGVRDLKVTANQQVKTDGFTFDGTGRQHYLRAGILQVSGTMNVEYFGNALSAAILAGTRLGIVLTYTGAQIDSGGSPTFETLQLVLPNIILPGALPVSNGGDLIVQPVSFKGLDLMDGNGPMYLVLRTTDTAL